MKKTDTTRLLVIILAVIVVIGLVLLIARQAFSFSGLAFEILAYVLSVVALILTVLSVMNGVRQGRVMKQIVKDVHAELKQMSDLNLKIEQDIREDQEVNKVISTVLSKYGIDENDTVRHTIQKRTHKHIKKHGL